MGKPEPQIIVFTPAMRTLMPDVHTTYLRTKDIKERTSTENIVLD
jgi:hypothetical protein